MQKISCDISFTLITKAVSPSTSFSSTISQLHQCIIYRLPSSEHLHACIRTFIQPSIHTTMQCVSLIQTCNVFSQITCHCNHKIMHQSSVHLSSQLSCQISKHSSHHSSIHPSTHPSIHPHSNPLIPYVLKYA